MLLLISPFMAVSICLIYWSVRISGAYIFTIVISFSWSFDLYAASTVSYNYLYFKAYFVWYEYCYCSFLLISICIEYLLQFSSVAQSCPPLCDTMNRSTPGLPVHHQLPEFTQTLVHWVRDANQPSHPLFVPFSSCPQSLPASESFPMSQQFTWGGQSTWVSAFASFLPKKSQGWSPSEWTGWISLQSKGLSSVFSNTTGQKHQFFSTQPSSQSNSHINTWPLEKPQPWLDRPLLAK